MALDPNHWTSKVQAAWKAATELASEEGHAETTVTHLAVTLFEDADGLARQVRRARVLQYGLRIHCETVPSEGSAGPLRSQLPCVSGKRVVYMLTTRARPAPRAAPRAGLHRRIERGCLPRRHAHAALAPREASQGLAAARRAEPEQGAHQALQGGDQGAEEERRGLPRRGRRATQARRPRAPPSCPLCVFEVTLLPLRRRRFAQRRAFG